MLFPKHWFSWGNFSCPEMTAVKLIMRSSSISKIIHVRILSIGISSSSDFWLTCKCRGHIHNSGPPSWQLACCTHGRSHTRSPGVSIMRVDSWELPLSAIPLCQLLPSHLGPPRPTLSINLYVRGCLDSTVGASMCPYQWIFRSSMPSHASSSVDWMVAVSCGLTLQICLIIALSFCCRHWRQGFVTG